VKSFALHAIAHTHAHGYEIQYNNGNRHLQARGTSAHNFTAHTRIIHVAETSPRLLFVV
jgi:hypothetical protein